MRPRTSYADCGHGKFYDCSRTVVCLHKKSPYFLTLALHYKVGSGVGAKFGILLKGGEGLEIANKLTVILFDKTGTLTIGRPTVEDVLLLSDEVTHLVEGSEKSLDTKDVTEDEETTTSVTEWASQNTSSLNQQGIEQVLFFAACAEHGSEHPLAKGKAMGFVTLSSRCECRLTFSCDISRYHH